MGGVVVRRQFLARRLHAAALALMLCLPSAHAARLDATTIGNGVVSMDYTGTDAGQGGSNLRLTAMGRWLDGRDADRYTIWRLRNNGTTTRERTEKVNPISRTMMKAERVHWTFGV